MACRLKDPCRILFISFGRSSTAEDSAPHSLLVWHLRQQSLQISQKPQGTRKASCLPLPRDSWRIRGVGQVLSMLVASTPMPAQHLWTAEQGLEANFGWVCHSNGYLHLVRKENGCAAGTRLPLHVLRRS
ncbi:hypothetical protein WJX82_007811 [Trebouxia sp. C0006]